MLSSNAILAETMAWNEQPIPGTLQNVGKITQYAPCNSYMIWFHKKENQKNTAYIELNDKLSNRHKHKFTNQREREQNEKKKKLTHSMCVLS